MSYKAFSLLIYNTLPKVSSVTAFPKILSKRQKTWIEEQKK